ncbi:hypothetical protein [Streptomyces sp. NPDC001380]|uniref:hypothetical protein n=1 Tax=Streptomyces sp. NPDC001380 TaxID=3364566 RepID=UPI0036764285
MRNRLVRKAAVATAPIILAGAAALAVAPTAGAAPDRPAATAARAASATPGNPARSTSPHIEDLAAGGVRADGRTHEAAVRLPARTAGPAAVQILLAPSGGRTYLSPGDARVERRDPATHRWEPVRLGSQTGTLYSALPRTGDLPRGSAVVHYRVTFTRALPSAEDRVALLPRLALYR